MIEARKKCKEIMGKKYFSEEQKKFRKNHPDYWKKYYKYIKVKK